MKERDNSCLGVYAVDVLNSEIRRGDFIGLEITHCISPRTLFNNSAIYKRGKIIASIGFKTTMELSKVLFPGCTGLFSSSMS